jgi:hypothetical protein
VVERVDVADAGKLNATAPMAISPLELSRRLDVVTTLDPWSEKTISRPATTLVV